MFTQVWSVEGHVQTDMRPPAEMAAEVAGGMQPAASEGDGCASFHTNVKSSRWPMNAFSHKCEV